MDSQSPEVNGPLSASLSGDLFDARMPFESAKPDFAGTQRFERWYMCLVAASVFVGLVIAVAIALMP